MTATEFVDAIRGVVEEASVSDTISLLRSPPGRKPDQELVEVSKRFNALGEQDRAMVKRALDMVAGQAVFGFLCVLDGSRPVEPAGPKGDFELRFIKDGQVEVLSGPDGEILHELF